MKIFISSHPTSVDATVVVNNEYLKMYLKKY